MRDIINLVESAQPRPNFNEAFWRWFGDSKVVDAQGNPLMVFHGTKGDIKRFDLRGKFRTGGKAFFFTPDPVFAHLYANKGGEEGGRIYPVFLRIIKMFDNRNQQNIDELERTVDAFLEREKTKPYGKAKSFYPFTKAKIFSLIKEGRWDALEHPIIIACLKKAGFDGATITEDGTHNFMVFDARQIKSVFNSGEWSPTDADINR